MNNLQMHIQTYLEYSKTQKRLDAKALCTVPRQCQLVRWNDTHLRKRKYGVTLSDQCVRWMINKYCFLAAIEMHITPHMSRYTFATSLLEADVDIRYIQEMLGHSSINITEIYTHLSYPHIAYNIKSNRHKQFQGQKK